MKLDEIYLDETLGSLWNFFTYIINWENYVHQDALFIY